jgi:hypothetical protein
VIKHFGFDFPPVGIIGVMEKFVAPDSKIYIVDPISGVELPYDELDSHAWVVINTNEGSSHYWFDRLITTLQCHGVLLDHIVIRSCCLWNPDSSVKHIHTIVDECSNFITMLQDYIPRSTTPTHHFVCLNHGHRWQRYELVKQILDRSIDQFGKISYLQNPNNTDTRFPLIIDQLNITWEDQRDITMPALTGALFNIICETAYEPDPVTKHLIHHHRPGMTEKSYKCFALFQIPIWLAPYRAVACYRQLGFDVFDDIIDHSYDLEPDPEQRIVMVADQIEKITELNYTQLIQIKTELVPRFEQNWITLKKYAHNFETETAQWKVLFAHNKP